MPVFFKGELTESELEKKVWEFVLKVGKKDWILLEGPMGAGKSTFARAFLMAKKVSQTPEGSPTFAIAHEYESPEGEIIHLDFYRLKSEEELEERGIPSYFWERESLVLAEWTSLFPEFQKTLVPLLDRALWKVSLDFTENENTRKIQIERV